MQRFKGTPDVLELDQLTVSGDVTFGAGVVLKVSPLFPPFSLPSPSLLPLFSLSSPSLLPL